ncbi:MAG: hypothetical protein VX498_08940 [Myxococcota bacterium]|nr:hypothetical protein [Myxococcota bacterium]
MRQYATSLIALSLLVVSSACDTGPWDAPPGSEIAEVEDIEVSWFGCLLDPVTGAQQNPNCEISPPVQIPVTVLVQNATTLVPLNNIRITFTSGFTDVYLLPQEVIEAIALPDTESWAAIMSNGEIWAEFSGQWEGDYRPTYYETWTDNNGLAEFWVWVERMPQDPTGLPKETFVRADIGVHHTFISLTSAQ